MGRSCSQNGKGRSSFKILTWTPNRRRLLGRPRRRWEDNIKMDLKEMGAHTRNWVDSAQGRDYLKALMNVVSSLNMANRCPIFRRKKLILIAGGTTG